MRVLVTGGTGFIGSHTVVALLDAGHEPFIVDDFSNSSIDVLDQLAGLTGTRVPHTRLDIRDRDALDTAVARVQPEAVIHFAARKHVRESFEIPLEYHDVNIAGTLTLLQTLDRHDCGRRFVYSSSGSIYGTADHFPIAEDTTPNPTNPYSATKATCERILADLSGAEDRWEFVALRYFNPSGAHPSGQIGEAPTGIISNLLPVAFRAALDSEHTVGIFGDDWPTPDGTAQRDYVHVCDVAEAHVRALDVPTGGFEAINIGRGVGVSVLEVLDAVERATGTTIRRSEQPRADGDVAALYGDCTKSEELLGFRSERDIDMICADAWRWAQQQQKSEAIS